MLPFNHQPITLFPVVHLVVVDYGLAATVVDAKACLCNHWELVVVKTNEVVQEPSFVPSCMQVKAGHNKNIK